MSDKPANKLLLTDRWLRRLFPVGMRSGVDVTIKKVTGFELFNTRPHHNYETWSDGYRIEVGEIVVEREDLDDALAELERQLGKGLTT